MGQSKKKKRGTRPRRTGVLDKRFQQNLRRLRTAAGLKQRELAEGLGWPNQNYVSQLENGIRGFSLDLAEELAKYFKIDPGEFFLPAHGRRPLRVLFEGLPKSLLDHLRASGKLDELIEKCKRVVRQEAESA